MCVKAFPRAGRADCVGTASAECACLVHITFIDSISCRLRIPPLAAARDMFARVLKHVDRSCGWGGEEERAGGWEEVYGVSRECLCGIVCTLYIRASPETHLVHLTLFTSWCTRHGGLRGPLVSPEDWHVIKPCACMCVYGPWRVCSEGLGYHCMFSVHV